jgi:hypothetical protein
VDPFGFKRRRREREIDQRIRVEREAFMYRESHVWNVAQCVRYAELAGEEPRQWQGLYSGGGTATASEEEIIAHLGEDWRGAIDRHKAHLENPTSSNTMGTILYRDGA